MNRDAAAVRPADTGARVIVEIEGVSKTFQTRGGRRIPALRRRNHTTGEHS